MTDTGSGAETWTVDQCADAWDISPVTWRSYVSRGIAPAPLPGYDEQRRRRWDADAVQAAHAARRGRGWRRASAGEHGG